MPLQQVVCMMCMVRMVCKDTDEGGGADGQNGAYGDGLLSISQITRAVRTRHDAFYTHTETEKHILCSCACYRDFYSMFSSHVLSAEMGN